MIFPLFSGTTYKKLRYGHDTIFFPLVYWTHRVACPIQFLACLYRTCIQHGYGILATYPYFLLIHSSDIAKVSANEYLAIYQRILYVPDLWNVLDGLNLMFIILLILQILPAWCNSNLIYHLSIKTFIVMTTNYSISVSREFHLTLSSLCCLVLYSSLSDGNNICLKLLIATKSTIQTVLIGLRHCISEKK